MKTRLTELLGIELPIVQAPMAGVSTPALAAAVSDAGGLGSIAVGAGSAAAAAEAMRATRAATNRAFAVNLFCHPTPERDTGREAAWLDALAPLFAELGAAPPEALAEIYRSFDDDDAMLAAVLAAPPPVVSFHFGLPQADRIAALKAAGCILLASATTPDEARAVAAAGIDAVVAQGFEAGGHRGTFGDPSDDRHLGTLALVRQAALAVDIPVVAAGGIVDGAGIAAALALGADGVQIGTAFVACPESMASETHRAALSEGGPTVVTAAVSGRPARGFANRLSAGLRAVEGRVPAYPVAYDAAKALAAAAAQAGVGGFAAQWAGQMPPRHGGLPAAELVRRLADECEAEIGRLQRLL